MYIVRFTKAYGHYLMEYPPDHNLHKLKWAWTLCFSKATRFTTQAEAHAFAQSHEIADYAVDEVK